MNKDLFEKGLAIRKSVIGAEFVDKALATADDFNMPLQELVTEYCWGAVWGREGLETKTRRLLNIALLSVETAAPGAAPGEVRALWGRRSQASAARVAGLRFGTFGRGVPTAANAGNPNANQEFVVATSSTAGVATMTPSQISSSRRGLPLRSIARCAACLVCRSSDTSL